MIATTAEEFMELRGIALANALYNARITGHSCFMVEYADAQFYFEVFCS